MKQLTVMGLGLMGGSLALAARRRGLAERVCGYARRAETGREAVARGIVDVAFDDPAAAVAGADMAVFCVPVLAIPVLADACRGGFVPGCVVTDVGSTKAEICRRMRDALAGSGAAFVGSHPIAGSDEAGLEAARADLYDGSITVVTPAPETTPNAVEAVARLWTAVGSTVLSRSPEEHDALLAATSHLPHMVAAALCGWILGDASAGRGPFCGPGFGDATRIAAGSESVWDDIVRTNQPSLLRALEGFGDELGRLTERVRQRDFEAVRAYLARSRELRGAWRTQGEG